MKEFKKKEKQYIYFRDCCKCSFCEKELHLRQASLDHYLPKSKGGPDAVYNIVLSCKTCNKLKKSNVPEDYEEMMIKQLKKGVQDRKVIGAGLKYKYSELVEMIEAVDKVEQIGDDTVFQSKSFRFYLHYNKITKVIQLSNGCER